MCNKIISFCFDRKPLTDQMAKIFHSFVINNKNISQLKHAEEMESKYKIMFVNI